ncbi:Uncharacterised protein [Bordetella pertussis]|nr:Uncharacterised protein [Bordetella pertussis]
MPASCRAHSSSSHCRLARGYATFTGACSWCCITD